MHVQPANLFLGHRRSQPQPHRALTDVRWRLRAGRGPAASEQTCRLNWAETAAPKIFKAARWAARSILYYSSIGREHRQRGLCSLARASGHVATLEGVRDMWNQLFTQATVFFSPQISEQYFLARVFNKATLCIYCCYRNRP